MKSPWLIIGALIIVTIFISSCATRKEVVQFKEDLIYLRAQTERLMMANEELRKALLELNKNFVNLQDETRRTKADLITEIDNLKTQSRVIDSKIEDNAYRMSTLLQRAETIPNRQVNPDTSTTANIQEGNPKPSGEVDPVLVYKTAYLDLSRGNYELALQGFQHFLHQSPQGELADNAQYWIGEVYYAQKNYQKAIEAFNRVVIDYPKGDKLAAALLKIGYCYFNIGENDKAKRFLTLVIERYPQTEEARLARSRLSNHN